MPVMNKRRRWTGPSSLVNPSSSRYRQAAAVASGRRSGPKKKHDSQLTATALAVHNMQQGDESMEVDADMKSVATSALGELPELELVNTVFAPVKRAWNSQNQADLETCAVFAAVTDHIQKKEQAETPTAYWAALMGTLTTLVDRPSEQSSAGAALYLLSLVCKAVPRETLAKRHDDAVELYSKILRTVKKRSDEGNRPAVKAMVCVKFQLRAAPGVTWKDPRTRELAQQLLTFCVDQRPKVRRAAQIAVCDLIELHAHKKTTFLRLAADFMLEHLPESRKLHKDVMYVLGVLNKSLAYFPPEYIKVLSKRMARVLLAGNAIATTTCLNAFTAFFTSPAALELPVETVVAVYKQLGPNCPPVKDITPRCTWNTTVSKAALCIASLSASQGAAAVSATTSWMRECLQEQSKALISSATTNIRTLFREALVAVLENAGDDDAEAVKGCVQSLVQKMDESLSYRFQVAFEEVLQCIQDLADALTGRAGDVLDGLITSLFQLHETPGVSCKGNIEDALRHCIRSVGPEQFLHVLPLNFNQQELQSEFPRAWLLLLMKNNVPNSTIAFFSREMYPIAMAMFRLKQQARNEGKALLAKTYDQLYFQIWLLLPSFFTNPSDTAQTFPEFAKTLGLALRKHNDLRGTVCKALMNLIRTRGKYAEDAEAIAAHAQNFMSVLLHAYVSEKSQDKQSYLLNTIKAFISLMSPEQQKPYFASALEQLLETDETSDACLRLLDIINVLVPGLHDAKQLEQLRTVLTYTLGGTKSDKVQKRGYRVLLSVCSASQEPLRKFFLDNLNYLQEVLQTAALSSYAGTKAPRLKCMHSILSDLPASQLKASITAMLPEVMLSTKEVNEETRQTAFEVLILIADLVIANQGMDDLGLTLDDLFQMVIAGLAGDTPHMISAAVTCISRLIYEYKEELNHELVKDTTATMPTLLQSPSREVVKSVLGFISMCFSTLTRHEFDRHMEMIVTGMFGMTPGQRSRHHAKVKILLTRLVRRYGPDRLMDLVPEEHHRLITNIRKAENYQRNKQAEKQKQGKDTKEKPHQRGERVRTKRGAMSFEDLLDDKDFSDDEDGDDADFQEFDAEGNLVKRAAKVKTFLRDDAEDDTPVDLLDQGLVSNITSDAAVATARKKKKTKKHGQNESGKDAKDVKKLEDGRLLVEDLEELKQGKKGRRTKRHGLPEGADVEDMMMMDDDDDDDDGDGDDNTSGLTFGRGIHRDRKKMAKEEAALEAAKWGDTAYDGGFDSDDDEDEEQEADAGELSTKRAKKQQEKEDKAARRGKKKGGKQASGGGLGAEFRSKKAAGDMRKKGQNVLPYAYLPMDPNMLNKRKRAKAQSTFKNIVKSAQKGARKGRKQAKRKGN